MYGPVPTWVLPKNNHEVKKDYLFTKMIFNCSLLQFALNTLKLESLFVSLRVPPGSIFAFWYKDLIT